MSEESKSSTPATPAPLGEIEHGPSKFDLFMEKNLKKLILLALLIVIGVAAFVITSQLADAKDREAGNALIAAESPDDYRKVSTDYPDSGAAASAQLLLAGQLWEEGKEDEAVKTLKSLAGAENHLASAQAKFTLAGLQLKQGKTDEAKSGYEAVLSNSEAKYLHPFSLVALGDIAKAAGEEEKAKEYYQRKLDDFPAYADQNIAVTRLNLVGVDAAEKISPPPAPEPLATPESKPEVNPAFTTPLPDLGATPPTPEMTPALETPVLDITKEEDSAEANETPETSNATESAPVEEKKELAIAQSEADLDENRQNLVKEIRKMNTLSGDSLSARYDELEQQLGVKSKRRIHFATGETNASEAEAALIDQVADSSNPESEFLLVGFADQTGDEEGNRSISSQRALSVAARLGQKTGNSRVQAIYLGQTSRFGPDAENRVVEIWEITPNSPQPE